MALRNYDPNEVVVILGSTIIEGLAPDGIQISRNKESFRYIAGLDTRGTRVRTDDHSGVVSLTLQQTAEENRILSESLNVDEFEPRGRELQAFLVKDTNPQSGAIYFAAEAWVKGFPVVEYSSTGINNYTWQIECQNLVHEIAAQ